MNALIINLQQRLLQLQYRVEEPPRPITRKTSLKKAVCSVFNIPEEFLFIESKMKPIINAKKCYMYFVCEMYEAGIGKTARHISLKHSTVIKDLRRFNKHYRELQDYQNRVDVIFTAFYSGLISAPNIHIPVKKSVN